MVACTDQLALLKQDFHEMFVRACEECLAAAYKDPLTSCVTQAGALKGQLQAKIEECKGVEYQLSFQKRDNMQSYHRVIKRLAFLFHLIK